MDSKATAVSPHPNRTITVLPSYMPIFCCSIVEHRSLAVVPAGLSRARKNEVRWSSPCLASSVLRALLVSTSMYVIFASHHHPHLPTSAHPRSLVQPSGPDDQDCNLQQLVSWAYVPTSCTPHAREHPRRLVTAIQSLQRLANLEKQLADKFTFTPRRAPPDWPGSMRPLH